VLVGRLLLSSVCEPEPRQNTHPVSCHGAETRCKDRGMEERDQEKIRVYKRLITFIMRHSDIQTCIMSKVKACIFSG
jgi:hypothetical protein